ncbi:MAG: hypothetical protein LBN08_02400 [Lactobacillales bacterium]|jgi:hypothetical protein|nr:hypothetical protein [Lactobacillales bacterium]
MNSLIGSLFLIAGTLVELLKESFPDESSANVIGILFILLALYYFWVKDGAGWKLIKEWLNIGSKN